MALWKKMWLWLKRERVFAILLLLFIIIRFYHFGGIPPGLNQDEAATGYDAFAVLKYGIDRIGFHNPIMFVSWGSGMYAIAGYLEMPFIWLFGLSPWSIRLPFAVVGILTLVIFYLLMRKTGDKKLSLLATFLLAISPWHFMAYRWSLDSNLFPALFLFAVYFLVVGFERAWALIVSAVFFALCLYAYGTAYVVVPGFLLLAAVYLLILKKVTFRSMFIPAVVFLLLSVPIALYLLINKYDWDSINTFAFSIPHLTGPPRYETISSVFSGNFIVSATGNLRTLWEMMVSQNDGLIWNSIPGYGLLYPFALPLIFIGLVLSITDIFKGKKYAPSFLFTAWLLVSIALAALQSVNVNRINIIFIPLVYFLAVGVLYIGRQRILLVTALTLYSLAFCSFTYHYFTKYQEEASGAFFESLDLAINTASDSISGPVCVSDHINQPYIFVLFFRRTDPNVFIRTVQYEDPHAEFQSVKAFDRYVFGLQRCGEDAFDAYVYENGESLPEAARGFRTEQFERYSVAIRPQ